MTRRPVVALAGVEARRLLTSPLIPIAVALFAWPALTAIAKDHRSGTDSSAAYMWLVGIGLAPLAFATLGLACFAALRARRDRTEELFDSLPVDVSGRTLGLGLALAGPALLGAVLILAYVAYLHPGPVLGPLPDTAVRNLAPRPSVAQLLQGPVVVAVLGALGIALARLLCTTFAVVPPIVVLFFATVVFGLWVNPTTLLSWVLPYSTGIVSGGWTGWCSSSSGGCLLLVAGYDRATALWHLAYLAAVGALLLLVSVVRHDRRRKVVAATVAAAGATAGLVAVQAVSMVLP